MNVTRLVSKRMTNGGSTLGLVFQLFSPIFFVVAIALLPSGILFPLFSILLFFNTKGYVCESDYASFHKRIYSFGDVYGNNIPYYIIIGRILSVAILLLLVAAIILFFISLKRNSRFITYTFLVVSILILISSISLCLIAHNVPNLIRDSGLVETSFTSHSKVYKYDFHDYNSICTLVFISGIVFIIEFLYCAISAFNHCLTDLEVKEIQSNKVNKKI